MAKFINKLKLYCLDKGKTEEEFNSKVQCQNDKDGKGDWISHWDLDIDKPTDEQLNALESEATKIENNAKVDGKRKAEYPTIEELVVALYDTDDKAAIDSKRAEIKLKYPKPGA